MNMFLMFEKKLKEKQWDWDAMLKMTKIEKTFLHSLAASVPNK